MNKVLVNDYKVSNPATLDNIMIYVVVAVASLLVLGIIIYLSRKSK